MERRWCAKESPKTRYVVAVINEGTITAFTSKAVAGVFAVVATGKYTVTSVSVKCEHVEWHGV